MMELEMPTRGLDGGEEGNLFVRFSSGLVKFMSQKQNHEDYFKFSKNKCEATGLWALALRSS